MVQWRRDGGGSLIADALKRVCARQPEYQSGNTVPMQERGALIRHVIPAELRALEPTLRSALADFGNDFDIGASDGIGRKTEAPWVRFFSARMSPTPRDGYYVVLHFAADGSAVYVTVGCGSTTWGNGELRPVSDGELMDRTNLARQLIRDSFGSLSPFDDIISLGARASLPRTFEKATAIAKRIPVGSLERTDIPELLVLAADRLRVVYEGQRSGKAFRAVDLAELELETIARPTRGSAAGQGFRLSMTERRAIEMRAMTVAREWLEAEGFTVVDKSRSSPFDYEASNGSGILKVEVKGTTAAADGAIFMTRNEVELHRNERGSTALIVVHGITLKQIDGVPIASGGAISAELGWDISIWDQIPLAFKLTRPVS